MGGKPKLPPPPAPILLLAVNPSSRGGRRTSSGLAASTVDGSGGGPDSRLCLKRHAGPYTQKPSLYMLQSLMSSMECLYGQSTSLQTPNFMRLRQTGILARSYSWRKPHASPFMHSPLSQYVHTVWSTAHRYNLSESAV